MQQRRASKVTTSSLWTAFCSSVPCWFPFLLYSSSLKHFLFIGSPSTMLWFSSSSTSTCPSIYFFNFSNYLLLKDGQDSIIFTYFFKHYPAVKLVAHLLEIISEKGKQQSYDILCIYFLQPVNHKFNCALCWRRVWTELCSPKIFRILAVIISGNILSRETSQISPVISFLCQQFFELAQSDDPSFDRRPVRYLLLTEVIRHRHVFTRLLFSYFMSANRKKLLKTVMLLVLLMPTH